MKLSAATLILISFVCVQAAEAKPISYVDGVMAMQENDETGHTLSLDYTLMSSSQSWYGADG